MPAVCVSNTSPLSNLAIIGRLDLLRTQCEKVLIPETVWRELGAMRHEEARGALAQARANGWLEVVQPGNRPLMESLLVQLDAGEAAAITLAKELNAEVLLIDERDGRLIASRLGLTARGVLGILLRAKFTGQLNAIQGEIERLETQAHFFIAPALKAEVLRQAGE